MPQLDRIYDRAFFEEWGANHDRYVRSAEIITDVLFQQFQPKRIVDIGCGCGVYSHFFSQKGVEVLSLDGVQPPNEHAFPVPIQLQDITVPFKNPWGKFDMALCLEVAEHIPEEFVDPFLANITQLSDLLILSAAPPDQGGHHHVNEQPKRYWVKHLAERGFLYQRKKTGRLMETFKKNKPGYMWMCEHISVYENLNGAALNWAGLPFSAGLR
jgi:SAM-dependent methyltransferase